MDKCINNISKYFNKTREINFKIFYMIHLAKVERYRSKFQRTFVYIGSNLGVWEAKGCTE